jgi:outer membrane protein assembly factor BamB
MNISSLYKDGRLFVPGDCTIYAVDAYNGTVLWQVDIPRSRRLAMSHDCGSMAVDAELLYVVAEDKCLGLDVKTGVTRRTRAVPQLDERQPHHWGYVAYGGDVLLGSGTKPGAAFTETSYAVDDSLWGRGQQTVTSDYLFGMDRASGKVLWTYRSGLILNTTIAAGGGRVYCVETTSPKAMANKLGRMKTPDLFDGGEAFLVALDQNTGKLLYRRPLDASNFEEIVFLNHARDTLVLAGSKAVGKPLHAYVHGFEAATGEPLWNANHDTELDAQGTHGEQNRHPTIVGQTVYAWPYAYELRSGKRVEGWKMDRRGNGCGEVSASAQCLFWRGANPWMYDLAPGGGPARLTAVTRIGCWINVIPAGGLVLIPESSSGCTCPFSIQTSIAFGPRETGIEGK